MKMVGEKKRKNKIEIAKIAPKNLSQKNIIIILYFLPFYLAFFRVGDLPA